MKEIPPALPVPALSEENIKQALKAATSLHGDRPMALTPKNVAHAARLRRMLNERRRRG